VTYEVLILALVFHDFRGSEYLTAISEADVDDAQHTPQLNPLNHRIGMGPSGGGAKEALWAQQSWDIPLEPIMPKSTELVALAGDDAPVLWVIGRYTAC
jgi:hypothetical protein